MTMLEILFLIYIILFAIKEVFFFLSFNKRLANIEVIIAAQYTKKGKPQVGFISES
jgi:hypothetical protein